MQAARATYAVIGDPVEHSLSPRIFARIFAETSRKAHYTALRVRPDELPEALQRVRRGHLSGLSVTLPHKESILPLLDELHPLAARVGAVNCVVRTPAGRLQGHNTDLYGFTTALAGRTPSRGLAGTRILLLGAGGAARAAAFAAVSAGAKSLTIANRDLDRALQLGEDLLRWGRAWPEGELLRRLGTPPAQLPSGKCYVNVVAREQLALPLGHADLLVNATSVGLQDPEADPLPAGLLLRPDQTVLDMVYRPLHTALLRRAEAAGANPVDGLWMLVHQAFEQLRLWTGTTAPPDLAALLHRELRSEAS